MPDKEIFVLKIVQKKSIALLHSLTQAVQRANLRRTAGDPTWVCFKTQLLECNPVGMYEQTSKDKPERKVSIKYRCE